MANDTATVTQTVNTVTVDPPSQSSLTVTSTSGGALTLSESTASLTAVTVSPLSASLTIESKFAPKESPNFTGIPTAPTASAGTNTTQIATTAFVNSAITLENTLAEMDDVNLTSLGDNEILQYDTSSSKWLNQTLTEAGIASTSSLSAHTSSTNNPHSVTSTQVGLGNVTNESKDTMFSSPTFTGTPLAPTASAATNSTQIATTAYVTTAVSNLIDSAPAALDTLNELAAALNDDASFSTTVTNSIATKLPLAGGTMTGNITMSGSQTVDGRDLSVDGAKLDGIEASATADQTASEIRTLVGSASDSNVFTDADHTKLDGIETGATADQTASEIRTLVESASDSNVFTDADHSKLNAIEASATADQTASEILTLIKTVDGASSGLDADLLDGSHASTFAPLASPVLTGIPTAPTANAGTNTTQVATTAFVNAAVALENTLAEMDDVNLTSLADNEILQYDSSSSKWLNQTLTEAGILPLAGGTMTGLVSLTGGGSSSPVGVNGLHLMYDSSGGTAHINAQHNGTSNRHLSFKAASYSFNIGNATFAGNLTVGDGHFIGDDSFDNLALISSSGENVVVAAANDIYLNTDASGGGTGTNRLVINETGATFDGTVTGTSFHQDAQATSSFYQATFDSDVTVASSLILHQAGNFNYISSQDASKDLIIRNTGSGKDMVLQVTSSGGTAELFRLRGVTSKEIVSSANFEIRNGSSARHINLYETYTDSSNYERSFFKHASSFLEIGTEALGTGTASGLKLKTAGADRVTVLSGGNVGIGTTNPTVKFHVTGSDVGIGTAYATAIIESIDAQLDITSNSSGSWGSSINLVEGASSSANTDVWSIVRKTTGGSGDSSLRFNFGTGNNHQNTSKITLLSDGKLGIGTTSPNYLLDVEGSGASMRVRNTATDATTQIVMRSGGSSGQNQIIFGDDDDANRGMIRYRHNGDSLAFDVADAERMRIDSSGRLGIGTTTIPHLLSVKGTISRLGSTGIQIINLGSSSDHGQLTINNSGGTTRVALNSSGADSYINAGKFGIGTTTPARKLEVSEGSSSIVAQFKSTSGTSAFITLANTTATADQIRVGSIGNDLVLSTNYAERMRILSDGKVGIGTTSPAELLHVEGSNATINVRESGAATVKMRAGSVGRIGTYSDNDFSIVSNSTDRVRIKSDGKVGIGTASPSTIFQVDTGDASGNKFGLTGDGSTTGAALWTNWTTGASHLDFRLGGTSSTYTKMRIQQDGKVGIGTTSPALDLHVAGTVRVDNNDGVAARQIRSSYFSSGQDLTLTAGSAAAVKLKTGSTVQLTAKNNGRVGIGAGATSPDYTLDVAGDIGIGDYAMMKSTAQYMGMIGFNRNGNNGAIYNNSYGAFQLQNNNGVFEFQCYNSSGAAQAIHKFTSDGRVGINTTPHTNQQLHIVASSSDTTGLEFSTSIHSNESRILSYDRGSGGGYRPLRLQSSHLKVEIAGVQKFAVDTSGNTLVVGDLTVQGDISTTGSFTIVDTDVSTTEQLSITNDGTGPALIVNQTGVQPIVDFKDDGTSVFNILNGGDIVMTGDLRLPDGSVSSPSLTFSGHTNTGIYWSNYTTSPQKDQINFAVDGATKAYINEAGVFSSGNVYAANAHQFRTFQEWQATTGGSGYGFRFRNTADSVDCLVISATGNLNPAGNITMADNGKVIATRKLIARDNNGLLLAEDGAATGIFINDSGNTTIQGTLTMASNGTGNSASSQEIIFYGTNSGGQQIDQATIFSTKYHYNTNAGDLVFKTGNTSGTQSERMRINGVGNVGIGTDFPLNRLHVETSDSTVARFKSATNKAAIFVSDDDTGGYFSAESDRVSMGFNSGLHAENINIQKLSGPEYRVGIGTNSPQSRLDIVQHDGASHTDFGYDGLTITAHSSASEPSIITFRSANEDGNLANSAKIGSVTTGTGSTYNGNLVFSTRAGASIAERMRVQHDGNVGIGNTSPDAKLHVGPSALVSGYTPSTTTLAVSDTTNGAELILRGQSPRIWFDVTSGGMGEMYLDGAQLNILSGTPTSAGSSRLYIKASGDVGIGVTDPASKLEVGGSFRISSSSPVMFFEDSSGSTYDAEFRYDNNLMFWRWGGGTKLYWNSSGTLYFGDYDANQATDHATQDPNIRKNGGGTDIGDLRFRTNNIDRMHIDGPDGFVGIGTTSPASILDVNGGSANGVKIQAANAATEYVLSATTSNGTSRLWVGGTGNVGIGTTSPSAPLHIQSSTDHNKIRLTNDNSQTWGLMIGNSGYYQGYFMIDQVGSGQRFVINDQGSVGIGTNAPARQLSVISSNANAVFQLSNSTAGATADSGLEIFASGVDTGIVNRENGYLRFDTNNTERVRITSGGDFYVDTDTLYVDASTDRVGIGTTSPAAPLSLVGVNGGSWNDGLIIDDPSGWAATVYKRSNSPKMFTGLYSGNDNYIWMSTGYSNSGTTITAPRADAVLMARPSTDDLQIYLETHFGNRIGVGTTSPAAILDIVDSQTLSGTGRATIQTTATTTATSTQSSGMYAIQNYFNLTGTSGSFQNSAHQQVMTTVSSTGAFTNLKNHISRVHTSGSGQINNVSHYNIHTELEGSGTISNWMGYAIADGTLATFTNTGHTITNTYGLYIGDITSGTQTNTPFGVYQANTDMRNYFGGNVGIGTASPSSMSSSNARRLVVGSGSGAEGITIYSGNTNGGYLYFADGTSGDASYRGAIQYSHSTDALSLHTAGTATRMIITNGGLVGIGVTNPQVQFFNNLVVGDNLSGDKGITIRSNNAAKGVLAFSDTDAADSGRYAGYISYNHSDNSMRFHTLAGNEHLTILSGGNVGVGNNNPTQAKLQVSGGSVLIDAYNATGTHGLFFRSGFVSSNQYNLSITCHNDGDGSPDALDINAYDGIYFNTGAGTRNNRAFINSSGKFCINQTDTSSDYLQVTGANGLYAARFNGSSTGGNSYGLRVRAGTNENDISFLAENTAGVDLFRVSGNGNVAIGNVTPTSKLYIHSGAFSSGEGEIRNDARVNRNYKLALGTTTKYIGTVQMNGNGDSSGFHVRIYDGHSKVWREVNVVVQNAGGTNYPKVTVEGGGDDVNINVEFAYVNRSGAAQKTDFYLVPTSNKAYTQLIFVDGFIERDTGHSSTSSTNINLDTAVGIYKAATDDSSRIGIGTNNPSEKLHVLGNAVITGSLDVQSQIIAPNAPTNLSLSVVGETINVTFTASNTPNISAYLVYSSVDGGDYGLISIIPPDDFGSTMSIIDSAFTVTGTQAYRVYAIKSGKMSSALTGSISYTVSSAEPTNLSVVPMNNAFYIQYDPPSSNSRFVSAYKIFKHEHANQGSLDRTQATEIYSGMNKSYMYPISGANNTNFHQFWVETTIAT